MDQISRHEEVLDGLVAYAFANERDADGQQGQSYDVARERSQVDELCDEIQHLASSALRAEKFFERFIAKSARIYRAGQVAIWLWDETHEGPVLCAAGNHQALLSSPGQHAGGVGRETLLACFQSGKPEVQRMDSAARANQPGDDKTILMQPVCLRERTVAVILVDLGSDRPRDEDTLTGYLTVSRHLGECLLGYLRSRQRRVAKQLPSFDQATRALQMTGDWIESRRESIRRLIEEDLERFAGLRFETLQENRDFAVLVHELLDANGLRSQCPECGAAAILRCLNTGNSKTGVFSFDHYIDGRRRYHCGATSFPKLSICNKPRRRPRSSNGNA